MTQHDIRALGLLRFFGTIAVVLALHAPAAMASSDLAKAAKRITPSIVLVRTITQHADPAPHEDFGSGTGIIMSRDGEILTNTHVVGEASLVEVLLPPFQFVTAKVVGLDREKDIARLKITVPAGQSLVPAVWGDSQKLRVGDVVIKGGFPGAINSLQPSFAHGIVTNVRAFMNPYSTPLITADIQISGGDSGGPLLNARGEVVGIDVATVLNAAGTTTVAGLAIPSRIAQYTWRRLAYGNARTGWLGFLPGNCVNLRQMHGDRTLTKDVMEYLAKEGVALPAEKQGFLIVAFFQKERAGGGAELRIGDIVLRMNGHTPQDAHELVQWITETEPGKEIALDIVRAGTEKHMRLKTGEFNWEKEPSPQNGQHNQDDSSNALITPQ